MSKIDDMGLFVRVVKAGGLAAAGRQIEFANQTPILRPGQILRWVN